MNIMRFVYLTALCFFILACGNESKHSLSHSGMACEQSRCLISFDVTSTSDDMQHLVYEISLSQNNKFARNESELANEPELVIVGTSKGEFDLSPGEKQEFEVAVHVTDEPDGSNVSVFDSK